MKGLKNKIALVTGAGNRIGIGYHCAARLASEGATVYMTDIDEAATDDAAKTLQAAGHDVIAVAQDVTSEPGWTDLIERIKSEKGRLDILVNNAGIAVLGPVEELTAAQFQRQLEVNLVSVFIGCKATVPQMRAQGGGAIVNVSSIAAFVTGINSSAYAASKAGVNMFSKTLALEVASANIRVNTVHPGLVDTQMIRKGAEESSSIDKMASTLPLGRMAEGSEIAAMVAFLASDDASYCTGGSYIVDGGTTAL